MLLADLRAYLAGFPDLTEHVGSRMYASRAPDRAEAPYLIFSTISGDTPYSLQGEIGTTQTLIQIAAWARDPNGPFLASTVAGIVRDKLSHFRGNWADRFINDCHLTNEPTEIPDEPDDGSDNWYHAVTQDYMVTHAQAVPTLA